ncbi:MAG: hypothetical protein HY696_00295 [Deltaproteobacteria bacterium]|nr:hypothetical protein [Deltaproteobacteria bacterium]
MHDVIQQGLDWYLSPTSTAEVDCCPTRDVFQARLDSYYRSLQHAQQIEAAALLIATIGEIGNNAFDHNLGQWRDQPGCWFAHTHDADIEWIVLADRGQGILASLHRVDPTLNTHQAALEAAFERQISGRAPEQRGNGLKFVRRIISGHAQRGLSCMSGDGLLSFGEQTSVLQAALQSTDQSTAHTGTLTMIAWGTR